MYDFRVGQHDAYSAAALRAWVAAGLEKQGKSQTELAKYLGVSQPRISEILKGKRRIQAAEIPKIAEYTGDPPPSEWLRTERPSAFKLSSDEMPQRKTGEVRFSLHENQNLLWMLVFSNGSLIDQFEVDAADLENFRRQLLRAIAALPSSK
jgi:transcriptional regulator with XRE-family HTH domain